MVAACLLAPAGVGASGPERRAFVPEGLLAAAEAEPDTVFPVIVQGRDGKDSRAVADEVAAERARTPGGGRGVGRRFRTISGVSAELSGKQILKLATKRWILAITPDAPMVATDGVPPANTVPPTLSGTAQQEQTLSAGEGLWSGTEPLAYAYQWQRCDALGGGCVDIAGASAASYTLAAADVGATVRVAVTASNAAGSASATSEASAVVVVPPPFAPANTLAPALSGTAREGETLTANEGLWSGTLPLSFGYQWQRCDAVESCVDIAGATNATYLLAAADVGASVRVMVTATNAAGSASAASAGSVVAGPLPPASLSPPDLSGTAEEGATLTSSTGAWSGTSPLAYAYQWQRCSALGDSCVDIAGATAATYTVTSADVDATVRVSVTASNGGGQATAASAASAVIGARPPVRVTAPVVSGMAEVGSTLTSTAGSWTGTAPLSYGYQWQRCGLYPAEVLGDGPLGYWRLGEAGGTTAADASGNGRGGSYTGGLTLGATGALSADPDGAAVFDGVSGTVTVAGIGMGAVASGFTLEAWVNAAAAQTDGGIVGKWRGYDGGGVLLWIDDNGFYSLAVNRYIPDYLSTTVKPRVGGWDHVAGTWDGTTLRLYVNGIEVGSRAFTGSLGSPTVDVEIGNYEGGAHHFDGAIDEVALYGRALPAAQVQEHYAARSLWCADIADATGASYTLVPADTHASVRALVRATNTAGSASATSEPTNAVAPPRPPVATAAPTIAGTTEDAQTLSVASGSWTGTEPLAHAYRWQRCDGSGGACTDIAGATGTTYSLTPADVGSTIRVVVTTNNIAGSASATSPGTTAVRAAPPANLVQPKVVGGAEEGLMLTAAEGRWSGTPSLAFTYRWQRCDAEGICADIPGATNQTYLLVAADLGASVQVIVTATNAAGAAAATSPRTAAVAPAPVLTGFSTRQHWPYAVGVPRFWTDRSPAGPAIAIVDSGIQAERADFGGRVVEEVTLTTLTPNSPGDGRGHGTFVASIAAGEAVGYTGADPSATLVSIDVMNDEGQALTSDVIAAADWIYENKALYDIRVANFSLTGSVESSFRFDPVNKAVEKLWLSGVVVVAAAGNYAVDGQESGVRFTPGNDPFVITAGATDVNGSVATADDFAAPWSAYGYTVDGFAKPELGAPGRYMVGAVPPSSRLATERPDRLVADGYMQLSGTSFAAPIVAGTASALLAAHPTWTPDQVKGALMVTADPTAALPPFSLGVGAIDAAGAADVIDPPNPNAALNQFLVADPLGGPVQVFDEAGWAATAQADPAWSSSLWGSSLWGSASWSVSLWGSASWSSSHWGSSLWGSDTAPSSGDSLWGSITDRAADDALPAGGYWITSAERAAAEEALGRSPAP